MSRDYGVAQNRGVDNGANAATITYKARGDSAAAARMIRPTRITSKDNEILMTFDGNGLPNGCNIPLDLDEINYEGIVQADTIAHAVAEANLPVKPSAVVLAKHIDNATGAAALINGTWGYFGGGEYELAEGAEEDHKIKIPLRRYRNKAGTEVSIATITTAAPASGS